MPQPPAVLIVSPWMGAAIRPRLEAQGWTVRGAWEATPAELAETRVIAWTTQPGADPALLDRMPNLALVACIGAGYDNLDVSALRARGVEVTHAKGVNAEAVADHAMGLLIGGWRDIVAADRRMQAGGWRGQSQSRPGLRGRRVGVVGLGRIGRAVAERCEPFGMAVRWWGPNLKPDAPWERAASLQALAEWCDILVIAAAANDQSRGLVDRRIIEAVGAEGMIVNVGRGSIIDEDELIAALKDRRLGRAGLDVFEQEPTPPERWAPVADHVVLTPHVGGGASEAFSAMIDQVVENVRRCFAGEPPLSPV